MNAIECLPPKAYERETSSLIKASSYFHCDNLVLVAFSQSRDIEIGGKIIHVRSALEWLLSWQPRQRTMSSYTHPPGDFHGIHIGIRVCLKLRCRICIPLLIRISTMILTPQEAITKPSDWTGEEGAASVSNSGSGQYGIFGRSLHDTLGTHIVRCVNVKIKSIFNFVLRIRQNIV